MNNADNIATNSWNNSDHSQKGKQGFQTVKEEHQKTDRITIKLTTYQKKKLTDYCRDNSIKLSDLVRFSVYHYLDSKNVKLDDFTDFVDPRQTNLFS